MAEEAVGAIVLIVNGEEIDCVSCDPNRSTGRKTIPTMNRKRINKYVSQGVKSYSLNVVVVVPISKSIDWDNIEGARITIENPEGGFRETYIDCSTIEVGESFNVDGETRRTLSMFALDHMTE